MPARVSVASFASVTSYDQSPRSLGRATLRRKSARPCQRCVAERRLIDDVRAVAHRRERGLDAVRARRRADLDDAELLRAQVLQIRRLVLAAALGQQVDDRIVAVRPARAAFGDREVELAQVHAAQVIREVGGGELQQIGDETHRAMIMAAPRVGYSRRLEEDYAMSEALRALQQRLAAFAAARDWEQFHSPKNLAMALSVEAAELVEEFQWLTRSRAGQLDAERRERVRLELADVFIYLLRLADRLDVDLMRAADDKIALNERKYPAERVRGDSRKYTEYD